MANYPHVPPLDPKDIPENCFAKWNEVDLIWEFLPIADLTLPPVAPIDNWNLE